MKWISHISHSYSCSNKLQEAIAKELSIVNRILITDLDGFKKLVAAGIEKAHTVAPRCKKMEFHWYEPGFGTYKDLHLSITGICSFHIYQLKAEES